LVLAFFAPLAFTLLPGCLLRVGRLGILDNLALAHDPAVDAH
jgi:hypothetical protein